ncbi:DUF2066 domain-containing protein [Marinimicrobium sp. ABcell2]|uniref:DUF2066 domain-containing protein n=1 Tax=Marinimicrobium sp. ABcell2 TaxID=3069751 RepID=UPI0027B46384|nr:DUF2066 domain-containing protein [Marinimicrobium sp. ABcell2]MDQ2078494.1 DUF2066 domain-containing protein [Marinimicrobium sp. ABcell2]
MTRILIITILWAWSASGWAGQVVDIYRAEVLVASQSASERRAAARQAFEELVQRVSGDRSAADHQQVREAIAQAQDYIYEFNYSSTRETLEVDGREVPAMRLALKFSPGAVESLLRSAGLPLWPANRPSVLVWLVTEDSDGLRQIIDDDRRQLLRQHAQKRGLPLILPLQDLEDRLAISARELWSMDESAVRRASNRYSANAILVGRYSRTSSGMVRSNWQLYHPLGDPAFALDAESPSELLSLALDRVAEHFAGLYAITPREEGPDATIIQVSGVSDFGSYKSAQSYLEGLALVRRAELVALRPDALTIRLYVEGDLSRLLSTLSMDGQLVPSAQSDEVSLPENRFLPRGTLVNPLMYRWQH